MKVCKAALARGRRQVRILLRRRRGFYVMRIRRGASLVPALIFQALPDGDAAADAVNGRIWPWRSVGNLSSAASANNRDSHDET